MRASPAATAARVLRYGGLGVEKDVRLVIKSPGINAVTFAFGTQFARPIVGELLLCRQPLLWTSCSGASIATGLGLLSCLLACFLPALPTGPPLLIACGQADGNGPTANLKSMKLTYAAGATPCQLTTSPGVSTS